MTVIYVTDILQTMIRALKNRPNLTPPQFQTWAIAHNAVGWTTDAGAQHCSQELLTDLTRVAWLMIQQERHRGKPASWAHTAASNGEQHV